MPDERQLCPYCHEGHPPGIQTCPVTGQLLICPSCDLPLKSALTECHNCGTSFLVAEPPPPLPEQELLLPSKHIQPVIPTQSVSNPAPPAPEIQLLISRAQQLQEQGNLEAVLEVFRQALAKTEGPLAQTLETLINELEEKRHNRCSKSPGSQGSFTRRRN